MSSWSKYLSLSFVMLLAGCRFGGSPQAKTLTSTEPTLFFREDWKQTPAVVPVTQEHVQNAELILTRRGPGGDFIKKSHHDNIPNDPWYIWSGLCKDGRWALTLQKKNAIVDLSQQGKIRWRTKQQGPNVLKVILGLADGTWLVSEQGFGETPDWHVFSIDISKLRWRILDIETITTGARVKDPDLRRVRSIGWTDLTTGESSRACTRVDWIEVYGKAVQP